MRDKEKQRKAQRQHYLRNKEKYKSRVAYRRELRKEWINNLRAKVGCSICDEDVPYCIDFHHVNINEKDGLVTRLLFELRSVDRVIEEIKKCTPVCSNCHRKIHYGDLITKAYNWEGVLEELPPLCR